MGGQIELRRVGRPQYVGLAVRADRQVLAGLEGLYGDGGRQQQIVLGEKQVPGDRQLAPRHLRIHHILQRITEARFGRLQQAGIELAMPALGPVLERSPVSEGGQTGTLPNVAFRPTSPLKLDGMRTEPPPSVPMAIGPSPAATAAPAPPEEPPGVRSRFHGLRVMPFRGESVTPLWPYSELVLWAKTMAPASRSRATAGASASPSVLSLSFLPFEAAPPFAPTRSLIWTGTPPTAPTRSPL